MTDSRPPISRRDALRTGLGLGAGLALGADPLLARALDVGVTASTTPAGAARSQVALVTKPIPSSGERIPVIGIGTARRYDVAGSEEEMAPLRETLSQLPQLGGTLIDTAAGYGRAEEVLGQLMQELGNRDRIFLATKVGAGNRGRDAGLAEIERSKRRLRTDHFELLQVHNLNGPEVMLPVLHDMKRAGTIKYLGVTTTSTREYAELEQLMRSEALDFIEVDYAIDNRDVEQRVLPAAADNGVAVLVALPFGRGRVFEAFGDEQVPAWAAELGIKTWAQFALKFIVSHPAVTAAIPGTANPTYLADNLGAAAAPMPDEAMRLRMAALIEVG